MPMSYQELWNRQFQPAPTTENKTMFFGVKGGKVHKAAQPVTNSNAFKPSLTECGLTVTPLNYFECEADALRYSGGRDYACKHCRQAIAA